MNVDSFGPKQFHRYERYMSRTLTIMLNNLQADAKPRTFNVSKAIPWKGIIFVTVFFILGLIIKPTLRIDATVWTGSLAIDSTTALGLMAVLSWAIRPFIQAFPAFLDGASERGFYNPAPALGNRRIADLLKERLENDPTEMSKSLMKFARKGFYYLFSLIVILPIGFLIDDQIRFGLLLGISAGAVVVIFDYIMLGWNSMMNLPWDIYDVIKEQHDKSIQHCPICKTKNSDVAHTTSEVAVTLEPPNDNI